MYKLTITARIVLVFGSLMLTQLWMVAHRQEIAKCNQIRSEYSQFLKFSTTESDWRKAVAGDQSILASMKAHDELFVKIAGPLQECLNPGKHCTAEMTPSASYNGMYDLSMTCTHE